MYAYILRPSLDLSSDRLDPGPRHIRYMYSYICICVYVYICVYMYIVHTLLYDITYYNIMILTNPLEGGNWGHMNRGCK